MEIFSLTGLYFQFLLFYLFVQMTLYCDLVMFRSHKRDIYSLLIPKMDLQLWLCQLKYIFFLIEETTQ